MTSLCNATRVQYLHVSKPCPYTQNCFKVTGFGVRGKKDITWKIVELKLGTWLQWQCTRRLHFFSIWLYQEEKKSVLLLCYQIWSLCLLHAFAYHMLWWTRSVCMYSNEVWRSTESITVDEAPHPHLIMLLLSQVLAFGKVAWAAVNVIQSRYYFYYCD